MPAGDDSVSLVVLADGMGGYKAGEVASEISVQSIMAELQEAMLYLKVGQVDRLLNKQVEARLIIDGVNSANEAIYNVSQNQPQCAGMGTILVLGLFTSNKLLVGHVGDSRMYRFRDQTLIQITEDPSLLQEQIKSGFITAQQAKFSANKNLVTRALGVDVQVVLELNEYDVEVGDIYLLCSDGLSDLIEDDIFKQHCLLSSNLVNSAQILVQMANDNGCKDIISVILVRVNKSFEYKRPWFDSSGIDNVLGWLKS